MNVTEFDPRKARAFAVEVVRKLRDAGFESVWAGGCVRDQLLGCEPKDYDVATNANPDQVRDLFGRRRTLAMGAAFGVITVVGSKAKGSIEIATFRRDADYSDGRHPDSVEFSSAEEDAQRRDFTINGLFYDPIADRVIDYVGGQNDLRQGVIRAIGSARDRISEDKLRMIRAVRFAARLGFRIEDQTFDAIRLCAGDIHVVSPERIGAEMRRILVAPLASLGLSLLVESRLLREIAPSLLHDEALPTAVPAALESLSSEDGGFCECLAIACYGAGLDRGEIESIGHAWRLSNDEVRSVTRIVESVPTILDTSVLWPRLQRVLVEDVDAGASALRVAIAVAVNSAEREAVRRARARIDGDRSLWDPPPLINGGDLKQLGLTPGPEFKDLLERVRDQQLEGLIATKDEAVERVRQWLRDADQSSDQAASS